MEGACGVGRKSPMGAVLPPGAGGFYAPNSPLSRRNTSLFCGST